jgi:hypothetical protein
MECREIVEAVTEDAAQLSEAFDPAREEAWALLIEAARQGS